MLNTNQPTTPRPRLGVVIPLANEEATVEELLRGVTAHLGPQDSIFCVLDHVSTDSTLQKVEAAAAIDGRVVPVWAPESRCVVDAYFRGYREALRADCGWILEMDGGLSHRPDHLPRFIAAMADGADFAAGSRFVEGGSFSGPLKRYLLSRGGTLLTNLMLGRVMRDMTSGFECFTHEALSHVVWRGVRSRAHFFQTEIRFLLREWDWVEVPIDYSCPSSVVGSGPVTEALRNLWLMRKDARQPVLQPVVGSVA